MRRLVGYDAENINGEIRILNNDVYKASFSSKPTFLVETDENAEIFAVDGTVAVPSNATALIDVKYVKGRMMAWAVRDCEPGNNLRHGSLHTPIWFRKICEQRGATEKYVAGGCPPICPEGYTLVDQFGCTGTRYYMVPNYVIDEFMSNADFKANSRWHEIM